MIEHGLTTSWFKGQSRTEQDCRPFFFKRQWNSSSQEMCTATTTNAKPETWLITEEFISDLLLSEWWLSCDAMLWFLTCVGSDWLWHKPLKKVEAPSCVINSISLQLIGDCYDLINDTHCVCGKINLGANIPKSQNHPCKQFNKFKF